MAGSVVRSRPRLPRTGEGGYVLISLYAILALLTGYGAALVTHAATELQSAQRSQASLQAMYAAEGGVDQAIVQLRSNPNWAGGSGALGATTTYAVAVQSLGGNRQRLTVQGSSPLFQGTVSRSVEAIVQTTPASLFPGAMFGNQSVEISGNALTDSYDSSLGPYGPGTAGTAGDVGTNAVASGSVNLSGNAKVKGNATVGVGGNPSAVIRVTGNATITGTRSSASTPTAMPPVTIPGGLTNRGTLQVNGNSTVTLPGGTYWYNQITINGNGQLAFTGPTTLYLSGQLKIDGNGMATAGNRPPNLVIYVAGHDEMEITGNGVLYGAVYAPQSEAEIKGNGRLFGAMIGREAVSKGNGAVHYDQALRQAGGGSGNQVQVLSWQDLS